MVKVSQAESGSSTKEALRKLEGANMDIDLASPPGSISWKQHKCPWNEAENTDSRKCEVKNVSICKYFGGVEYLDTVLCYYPGANPLKKT